MKLFISTALILVTVLATNLVQAHHSFAAYNTEAAVSLTGTMKKVSFKYPHILFDLAVINKDGNETVWEIETMHPSLWDDKGFPRDLMEVGDTVTIEGWAGRNGVTDMILGTVTVDGQDTVILDRIPGFKK